MQVENVHERLREARERHRVMRGNPFDEVRSGQIGELGVTVLGYDECQTVLTHPDTFSSSIYDQIMGPVMGRTLLELEGAEHRVKVLLTLGAIADKEEVQVPAEAVLAEIERGKTANQENKRLVEYLDSPRGGPECSGKRQSV